MLVNQARKWSISGLWPLVLRAISGRMNSLRIRIHSIHNDHSKRFGASVASCFVRFPVDNEGPTETPQGRGEYVSLLRATISILEAKAFPVRGNCNANKKMRGCLLQTSSRELSPLHLFFSTFII